MSGIKSYKRQKNSSIAAVLVIVLFFVFAMAHAGHFLFTYFTTESIPLETLRLSEGAASQPIEGVIIRYETVYPAPASGVMQYNVNVDDFPRLRPMTLVASVQQHGLMDTLRPALEAQEQEMRLLSELRGNMSDPAVQHIDAQISNMVNTRLSQNIRTSMAETYALIDSVSQSISSRNHMILLNNENILPELDSQARVLDKQLSAGRTGMHITEGGVISTFVDGFETQFTPSNMYGLTREQTRQNINNYAIIPRREVEEGDAAFKVVNSSNWFIAAHIPNEQAGNLSAGQTHRLCIEGRSQPLEMRVHSTESGFADTLVIFRTNKFMTEFLPLRSVTFSLAQEHTPRLSIPDEAITVRRYLLIPREFVHGDDGRYYVQNVFGDGYVEVPIAPLSYCDTYFHIADDVGLRPGDSLLNDDDTHNIASPHEVEGVFRFIYGAAAFTEIQRGENCVQGEGYILLEPSINPNLSAGFRIVRDASMVEDGQILVRGALR